MQVFCPEAMAPFADMVSGDLTQILSDNGLQPNHIQVQQISQPLPISSVFPQIFRGGSGVDVKA